MIFVSDHAISSKWWWMGAIRNTRLRKVWKEKTWTRTLSASTTKIPPSRINSTSVFVITASPAIAPPSPSVPPPDPEGAGVAHEDRRRKRVEPQEADARPDHAARDEREVALAGG